MSTEQTARSELSADEMFETLTGFEEMAIATHFGGEVTDLAEKRPLAFVRALVFVDLCRRDTKRKHREVFTDVQGMPLKAVNGHFAESEDEPMPEDPVTAEGEGDELAS